jgi:hypothetical protein
LPPFHGLEATECVLNAVGQRQNPSWCLAVMTTPFMPASFITRTHCRASSAVGLKTSAGSSPWPHSLSVKVLGPKWMNPVNSRSCQASWRGEGSGAMGAGGGTVMAMVRRALSMPRAG